MKQGSEFDFDIPKQAPQSAEVKDEEQWLPNGLVRIQEPDGRGFFTAKFIDFLDDETVSVRRTSGDMSKIIDIKVSPSFKAKQPRS